MMATSNLDSCLESISVPQVSNFDSTDYTDVNKSYFEQEHAELETMPCGSLSQEGMDTEPRITRRSKESKTMSARREKIKTELGRASKKNGSLPDVSSPSCKRRRFLDVTNQPNMTPNVLRRGLAQRERAKSKIKTTAALEEERIAEEKERMRLLREETKETYEKTKKGVPKKFERTGAIVTKVEEFHFATDARVKTSNKADDELKNFRETLRKPEKEEFKIPKSGKTVVKPFNLTESKKRPRGEAFKSLAQGVQEFYTSSHRSCEKDVPESQEMYHFRSSTIAKTPKFSNRVRRHQKIESYKDLEEKEFEEECRKNQFKANPLNEKVLKNKPHLKEVEKRKPTKMEPFKITDEVHKKEKPLPEKKESVELEARKGATSVMPFSFDSKDKQRYEKKERKIKEEVEREKKLHEFQANPMPIYNEPHGIPEAKPPKATKVEPFNLHESTKSRQAPVEEKRNFRARPAKVLEKAPFIPKTGEIPPVLPDKAFVLHTDQRSEDRERFILDKKEREAEITALIKRKEEEQQKEEEEKLKQQRANAVHKAQPVHHYKPVEIKHGLRPVTNPVSPKFSDRFTK